MRSYEFSGLASFIKKSDLASFPHNLEQKFLILESDAGQGYFSEHGFPTKANTWKDHHLFLVVRNPVCCFDDHVQREVGYLSKKYQKYLRISPGTISYLNTPHQCIRFDESFFDIIPELAQKLEDYGIEYIPQKQVSQYNSLIHFKKFIEFKMIADEIYADAELYGRYFIKILSDIEFEQFEILQTAIHNNSGIVNFDTSLVYVPRRNGLTSFISIFSNEMDISGLQEIHGIIKHSMNYVHDDLSFSN